MECRVGVMVIVVLHVLAILHHHPVVVVQALVLVVQQQHLVLLAMAHAKVNVVHHVQEHVVDHRQVQHVVHVLHHVLLDVKVRVDLLARVDVLVHVIALAQGVVALDVLGGVAVTALVLAQLPAQDAKVHVVGHVNITVIQHALADVKLHVLLIVDGLPVWAHV